MWEQIQSNKRKTWVLIIAMAAVLLTLGFVIGEAVQPGAGLFGLGIAFLIWLVMSSVAWFQGDNILLTMAGATPIEHEDHPVLHNVVEEMKIASGLDHMPKVYMVNDMSPNAFAVGRNPDKAAVAVTAGLLGRLNRDELQGVVAHEVGHIVNRDVLLMTMLATTIGTISVLSETFLRALWYGGGSSRRYRSSSSKDSGGGQAQALMMVLAIVFAILAPVLAQLIYFAVSRKREYLADAQASVYTRYPEGLASALEKISGAGMPVQKATKATAAMYISNPMKKAKFSGMTATHPPAQERIAILRSIGNVASYGSYQQAWQSAGSGTAVGLPKSALQQESGGPVREATPEGKKKKSAREQIREAGDLMREFNDFIFLACVCGMRFKLPPEYKHDTVKCPKCSRVNPLPTVQMAQVADAVAGASGGGAAAGIPGVRVATAKAAGDAQSPPDSTGPLKVKRDTSGGWQSIKCSCGKTKSISPGFTGNQVKCGKCRRRIMFE